MNSGDGGQRSNTSGRLVVMASLLTLLLLAFGIRLYQLDGRSLWSDEGLSIHRAQGDVAYILSNRIVIQGVVTKDTQPPLYFLLLHAIMRGAGDSDFSLKFLSVAFSVLAIPLFYVLGRRLFDHRAGLLTALFGAVSPLYLWYAQELRMYAALVATSLLSTYALLRINDSRGSWRPRWALVYVLATAAMLNTHYSGFFLLLFQGLAFVALILRGSRLRGSKLPLAIGLLGLAALSVAPLVPFVIRRFLAGSEFNYWFVPLTAILRDLWNAYSLGLSVDPSAPTVLALDALFLAVAVVGFISPDGGDQWWRIRRTSFLLGYLLVPILALYTASYVKPMYQSVRHLMIASPAYYLALAVGLTALRKRGWLLFLAVVSVLLLGATYSSANYFFDPSYAKDDLRGMIRYVERHSYPDDIIVLSDSVILSVFDHYYRGQQPRTAMPPYGTQADASTLEDLEALLDGYRRVWFLYGPPGDFYDPQAKVKRWLDENRFKVDDVWFHGRNTVVAAACYVTSWPILQEQPVGLAGPQANLGNRLAIVGLDTLPNPFTAGGSVLINLYLQPLVHLDVKYKIALSLVDDAGYVWGEGNSAPFNGLYPTTEWPVGKVIRVGHEMRVDPGTPPGTYRLRLQVYRSGTEEALDVIEEGGNPRGRWLDLGAVRVVRPAVPPSTIAVTPQHPFSAEWGGGLRLLGFDLVSQIFEAGDRVPLAFHYLVGQAPERDYQLRLELVDASGQVRHGVELSPVRADYPTSQWRAGDLLKGQHTVALPPELSPGYYRLRISLIEPDADRFVPVRYGWLPLPRRSVNSTTIQIQARERAFQVPPILKPLDVQFGDAIKLLGYDPPEAQFQSGETLEVTLYWQAQATLAQSYKVTVQLLSDEGRVMGQDDAVPARWSRPTTSWLPEEVVIDPHRVAMKEGIPPGRYTLIVALYDEQTGERLPVASSDPADHAYHFTDRHRLGGDRIILGTVQVVGAP